MAHATIGELVKTWRSRRSCSQMALALDVGVSTRHLSFVETGRSKPSPALTLRLLRAVAVRDAHVGVVVDLDGVDVHK